MKNGRPDQLVMSFHGVPRDTLIKGDPYHCECHKTTRLLGEALKLAPEQYQIAFQSRFGRGEWLKPLYRASIERSWPNRILVAWMWSALGFVGDCLETLEEIAIEGKTLFHKMPVAKDYRHVRASTGATTGFMRWPMSPREICSAGWAASPPPAIFNSHACALTLGARLTHPHPGLPLEA